MAANWLDLLAEDSNISLASSHDAEFDNSRQGVNLLFKKNVKIISDDSQSRKRTFKQMQMAQEGTQNENALPPKTKQRTNIKGDWNTGKKCEKQASSSNTDNEKIGFSRFLKWADDKSSGSAVLGVKSNDNAKNMSMANQSATSNNNKQHLVVFSCTPSEQNRTRRRSYRAKRSTKTTPLTSPPKEKQEEEEEEEKEADEDGMDEDEDDDLKPTSDDALLVDDAKEADEQEQAKEEHEVQEVQPSEQQPNKQQVEEVVVVMQEEQKLEEKQVQGEDVDVSVDVHVDVDVDMKVTVNANDKVEVDDHNDNADDDDDDDDEDEDEDADDDLLTPIQKYKECGIKRRITPTLENVSCFGHNLIFSKVPILKKKTSADEVDDAIVKNAPMLLNADEFERLHKDKAKATPTASTPNTITTNTTNTGTKTTLMFSRESSLSVRSHDLEEQSDAPAALLTATQPSSGAIEWRQKQISLGKNTAEYKNFVKKYPEKDLRFRLKNRLIASPDPNEKIGKKRWVGKYQKWRKFLHQFNAADDE